MLSGPQRGWSGDGKGMGVRGNCYRGSFVGKRRTGKISVSWDLLLNFSSLSFIFHASAEAKR
jgi:hypothetical protein